MFTANRRPARARVRTIVMAGALVGMGAVGAGFTMVAQAQGGAPSTTNVSFVSLATPYRLYVNHVFNPGAAASFVVIAGSTKLPTNATTVKLSVSARDRTVGTSGELNFYPAGNPSGSSGQQLIFNESGQAVTGTIEENVGLGDELTVVASGNAAISSATIVGYSTQVTDGDVSGLDGQAGQVLTNTGTGAQWQSHSWAYTQAAAQLQTIPGPSSDAPYASLAIPAGNYIVSMTGRVEDDNLDTTTNVFCGIAINGKPLPAGDDLVKVGGDNFSETVADSGAISTPGGTLTAYCGAQGSGASIGNLSLIAQQADSVIGAFTNN